MQSYLWDAAGNVCVEVEILLDGRHEDELAHQPVCGGRRAEVPFKNLTNRQV